PNLPSSPPFPYTTLFRSARQQAIYQPVRSFIPAQLQGHIKGLVINYRAGKRRNMSGSRSGAQIAKHVRLAEMEDWINNVATPHRDRKSTRLNSSHVKISY